MGGVHGQEAQKERARKKAEKRRESEMQAEERRIKKAVDALVLDFRKNITATVREVVAERLRRVKAERDSLRERADEAKKLAEDRRRALDEQVVRARKAEDEADSLRERMQQAGSEAKAALKQEREDHRTELEGLKEIVEEQASTIKAQATALRAAEKKARG